MSLGHLNYEALSEEFCVAYFKVHKALPSSHIKLNRKGLIKTIWKLRSQLKKEKSHGNYNAIKI